MAVSALGVAWMGSLSKFESEWGIQGPRGSVCGAAARSRLQREGQRVDQGRGRTQSEVEWRQA